MIGARRLASVMLALLILVSTISVPVAATSTATVEQQCTETDEFFWTLTLGWINSDVCDSATLSAEIAAMEESDRQQTQTDLYNAASTQKGLAELGAADRQNYLQDSETFAWTKGESATFAAIENGSTQVMVDSAARGAVADYYARHQLSEIDGWNMTVLGLKTLNSTIVMEEGMQWGVNASISHSENVGDSFKRLESFAETPPDHVKPVGTETVNVTLVNGTVVQTLAINMSMDYKDAGGNDATAYRLVHPFSADNTYRAEGNYPASGEWIEFTIRGVNIAPPTSSFATLEYVDLSERNSRWENISSTSTRLENNIGQYSTALYEGVQNGTVNASQYTDPTVMAQEYATDYDETGYWSHAVAFLAHMGLETPDLNSTGTMLVNYSAATGTESVTGLVMSQEAPDNGKWYTNRSYNASAINGTQFLITTDGKQIDLEGRTFTIAEMTDKDGNPITQTTTHEYVYKGVSTEDYEALQQQLADLRQEIEDREQKAGGGGSGSGWSWDWLPDLNDPWLLVGVGVGGIALIGALGLAIKLSRPF